MQNLNRLCCCTKRRCLTSIKSANNKSLVFRGRSKALNINHRFLVKFSITKFHALPPSASLVVWMLTMLKRCHLSELSISRFPTPKRGWSLGYLWDFSLLGSGVCSVVFHLCSKPRNRQLAKMGYFQHSKRSDNKGCTVEVRWGILLRILNVTTVKWMFISVLSLR